MDIVSFTGPCNILLDSWPGISSLVVTNKKERVGMLLKLI